MQRCVQRLTFGGAALLVCPLFLLGASPRPAHAIVLGEESCHFEATADAVNLIDLPQTRTLSIDKNLSWCTVTPPSIFRGILCDSEPVDAPIEGTWVVTFESESEEGIVDITVDDLSGMSMSEFSLCTFATIVQSHTITSQRFTYTNDVTKALWGTSTDKIVSLLNSVITVQGRQTGTYTGSINSISSGCPMGTGSCSGTMTMVFDYEGTWVVTEILPGLSPLGVGVLTALFVAGGGFALWRQRARGT